MNVDAIDEEVVGHLGQHALAARTVAKRHDVVVAGALNLEERQPPVMRPRRGHQRGRPVALTDDRERACVRGRDASAIARQTRVAGRADRDPRVAGLPRQREVPGERRAWLQRYRVARLRGVDRLLQVRSRGERDGRRQRGSRAQQHARTHTCHKPGDVFHRGLGTGRQGKRAAARAHLEHAASMPCARQMSSKNGRVPALTNLYSRSQKGPRYSGVSNAPVRTQGSA